MLEKKLQHELNELLQQEELMWFQRSRANWLRDGDHNTKYYHLKVVQIRRWNKIFVIKYDNGHYMDDEKHIKDIFVEHYKKNLLSRIRDIIGCKPNTHTLVLILRP